jgi:hypothetical protein
MEKTIQSLRTTCSCDDDEETWSVDTLKKLQAKIVIRDWIRENQDSGDVVSQLPQAGDGKRGTAAGEDRGAGTEEMGVPSGAGVSGELLVDMEALVGREDTGYKAAQGGTYPAEDVSWEQRVRDNKSKKKGNKC